MNERPAKFSHFQLARRGGNYALKMVSLDAYQAERRHSGNTIKDRSESTFPWVRVYHSKIDFERLPFFESGYGSAV
ncbi:hypothetical protein ALP12_200280 [Pseudomonas savastanoi pv. phaseolicola]|uniref:Uncharacterized protein n=1 Tax=Pseudomonas savastanoi pv. glycinea TaxID=318 RepID=A0A3M3G0B5_PSESG|nr:hypothetical protein [Pseudomonas savastanoi]RMM67665.1 hypothetical protein ALQ73_200143 [Pseudomonas savastanoi pv. glycinea]RMV38570.1 hypothetical protein ALP12_200280 [Pseudomonas savastanoi pv. phaseolicola]